MKIPKTEKHRDLEALGFLRLMPEEETVDKDKDLTETALHFQSRVSPELHPPQESFGMASEKLPF